MTCAVTSGSFRETNLWDVWTEDDTDTETSLVIHPVNLFQQYLLNVHLMSITPCSLVTVYSGSELLTVALITVIMMMMTVMMMSINRLGGERSPRAGFKTTALCRSRHTTPLTSCHIGSRLSPLPLFLLFCFPLHWQPPCHSAFGVPFTGDSLSDSASLHHAQSLFCPVYSPPPAPSSLYIQPFCLSYVYLRTLLHLYPSSLNLLHFSLSYLFCSPMG